MSTQKTWWWLSFVKREMPAGRRFQGVSVVLGANVGEAIQEAHRRKINPGGEVAGVPLPPHMRLPVTWQKKFCNRLLSEAEAKKADKALMA